MSTSAEKYIRFEDWKLVHGRLFYGVADVMPSLAHSWVDLGGGEIFDVFVGYLSLKNYRERLTPKAGLIIDHEYSRAEVVSWCKLTGRKVPYRSPLLRTDAAVYAFIRVVV